MMVQKVPRRRLIGVFLLAKAMYFSLLQHFFQIYVIGVQVGGIVVKFKHGGKTAIRVHYLVAANQGQTFGERFKDFEPSVEGHLLRL